MRILIFHGYLLAGTGSNVYNARLASALVDLGHDVHMLCQDRHPDRQPFVDAAGDWDGGSLRVRTLKHSHLAPIEATTRPSVAGQAGRGVAGEAGRGVVGEAGRGVAGEAGRGVVGEAGRGVAGEAGSGHERGRCTVYRPDIGLLLPVYVADRYEGIQARIFPECTDSEVAAYVEANVAAVRELAALARPEMALANHLVMGPLILARGIGGEVPYAVKIHGSALEYTVKPCPERFLEPAREGLAGARAILAGSRHTARSLWQALGDPTLERRTRLGPPGVDVDLFIPRDPPRAREELLALTNRLRTSAAKARPGKSAIAEVDAFARDDLAAASALDRPGGGGVAEADMLARDGLAAASAFGRPGKSAIAEVDAFARDDLAAASALACLDPERDRLVAFVGKLIFNKGADLLLAAWPLVLAGEPKAKLVVVGFGADRPLLERLLGALEAGDLKGVEEVALPHLAAFIRSLSGDLRAQEDACASYLAASRSLPERVVLTGRLDHEELAGLLPACEALLTPSTFPESFGMVAAEAAACGVLPISAAHSGLAEVSEALACALPSQVAPLLSFPIDDACVSAIAERILAWLQIDRALREQTRAGLVATARERWSWRNVARGVIAAAHGELDALERP